MKTLQQAACSLVLAGGVLVWLGANSAHAQTYGPYLKVGGGVNLITDTDLEVGAADGTLELDAGFRVDGSLGYELNRWVAVELEGGYTDNSLDRLRLNEGTADPGGDSSYSQIPLLANVVFRYENHTSFVPYLGVGAGGVMTSLDISDEDDEDVVFAWQGKAGIIYKIDERAWLDVGYKFFATADQEFEFGNQKLETDQVFNHFFGLNVIWKF